MLVHDLHVLLAKTRNEETTKSYGPGARAIVLGSRSPRLQDQ
jgi:hypothetical protein